MPLRIRRLRPWSARVRLLLMILLIGSMPVKSVMAADQWVVTDDAPFRVIPGLPVLVPEGEELKRSFIEEHELYICLAFSPDGRYLAAGSPDKTVKLWDLKTKALIHTFSGHPEYVGSVAFSPVGSYLASASGDTIKLWDLNTKKLEYSFEEHSGQIESVAFSPDGCYLASGSWDETVKLWDLNKKKLVHTFKGHSSYVSCVAFSSDGRLASGSLDQTVKLWDLQTKALIHTFQGHSEFIDSVAFSPDGRQIAFASNQIIKLFDLQSKKPIHDFKGHSKAVQSVAFTPNGRFLASGSYDHTVKLWDLQDKALIYTFEDHSDSVQSVAVSPDGRYLASSSSDDTAKLWDLQTGALIHTFEGHLSMVDAVAYSPDGRYIASGARDRTVKLWDLKTKALKYTFKGHKDVISSVAFSPDSWHLASWSWDDTVKLWDLQAMVLKNTIKMRPYEKSGHRIFPGGFSPDGRFLAIGSGAEERGRLGADGSGNLSLMLLDLQTQKLIPTVKLYADGGHSMGVISVVFSPDGRHLASVSQENSFKLWDWKTKKLVRSFEGHSNRVECVAFGGPDGRRLASGSEDGTVNLWDLNKNEPIHTFEGHNRGVRSIAFSPDGRYLAASGRHIVSDGEWDESVKVWDLNTKELVRNFKGHKSLVRSVAFSRDSRHLASGSWDTSVRLWDVIDGKEELRLLGGQAGNWLVRDDPDSGDRGYRGDDGTLFKQATNGDWEPVRPQGAAPQDHLVIIIEGPPQPVIVKAGENKSIEFQVWNKGAAPAYWLQVQSTKSDDGAVQLDPPETQFNGGGDQSYFPWRLAKLVPGESAELFARISPNLIILPEKDVPSGNCQLPKKVAQPGNRQLSEKIVPSGIRQLPITVVSANDTAVTQIIEVDLRVPKLILKKARLDQDGKTLNVELENQGKADLRNFSLHLMHPDKETPKPERLTILLLAAGATLERPLRFPGGINNLDLKDPKLTLQVRTLDLPAFCWDLNLQEIQRSSNLKIYSILSALLVVIFVSLFYVRRYRHPLLVQLTHAPAQLMELPVEQLADAHNRLRQTNRLKKVLSEARVGVRTFQQAVRFVHSFSDEEQARWIAARLGGEIGKIASNLWECRLPERFPLNLERCLLLFAAGEDDSRDFLSRVKGISTGLTPVLLMGPDSDFQRKLLESTRDRSNKLVAPSGKEITRLLLDPDPERVLAGILAAQLSLIQLSPYQLGGGVQRESCFFGRQEIMAHIMNRDPANYLLVGGRQLGKSTLLKALKRRYADHPVVTCRYMGLGSEILVPRLADLLGTDLVAGLDGVIQFLYRHKGRFLLLIDEADLFIRRERQTDYQTLAAMRRMSEEGLCHFILAGFWELYDHAVLDYHSPLKNFGEILELGELEPEACYQLAVKPLANMRLAYQEPRLVERILEATGRRANLVALVCHQIISQLKADQRTITREHVAQALQSREIQGAMRGWEKMTDDPDACRLDRIVVYATIAEEYFTLVDLVQRLQGLGLTPDTDLLDRSLARLQLGFVLGRDDQGHHFYRVPLFREMVLQDDPSAKLALEAGQWRR